MLISSSVPATSGGTESILMAVKTHRDWARATKGVRHPEMWVVMAILGIRQREMGLTPTHIRRIIPSSAHAAFWKASDYFGIKLHVIPVDKKSRKADVSAMRRAV
jgi:sphinganine-1-phosphate aldolase